MNEKTTVAISRHWHSPVISVVVSDEGISVQCSLDDFISALSTEMAHPMKLFTRKGASTDISRASEAVLEKLKQASAHAA